MAVMMPREKWTDERLDDLSKKVGDGFADTKAEMRAGFARVDGEIKELRQEMNSRFESMNRNMFAGVIAIVTAIIGSNAALIASNAF